MKEYPKETSLIEMHKTVREELAYRRSRQQQIFTWSSAILVTIIAAMLVSKPDSLVLSPQGKCLAIILVIIVSLASASWQMKQRVLVSDLQVVISRIMSELGYFNLTHSMDKKSVIPKSWETWGTHYNTWWSQLTHPTKIVVTFLLGLAASIAIFLR